MESDEFYDLVLRVFENGQRTREQERVKVCARILRGVTEGTDRCDGAEAYMGLAMELSADEMRVAQGLYQNFGLFAHFSWPDIDGWIKSFEPNQAEHGPVQLVISRLQAKRVLRMSVRVNENAVQSRIGGVRVVRFIEDVDAEGAVLLDEFAFTDFFGQFLGFLSQLDIDTPAGGANPPRAADTDDGDQVA